MSTMDPMLELYLVETEESLHRLEEILLSAERNDAFLEEQIDEIFRILHTVKGSSAMMEFNEIARLAHVIEDLFSFLREQHTHHGDHQTICDLTITANDFMQAEMEKLKMGQTASGEASSLVEGVKKYHTFLKGEQTEKSSQIDETTEEDIEHFVADEKDAPQDFYKAHIFFSPGCQMENTRAFGVIKSVEKLTYDVKTIPEDVLADFAEDQIIDNGFVMYLRSDAEESVLEKAIAGNMFIHSLSFTKLEKEDPEIQAAFFAQNASTASIEKEDLGNVEDAIAQSLQAHQEHTKAEKPASTEGVKMQSYMNVNLAKLNQLMELVGEIVISEGTVIAHADIQGSRTDSFDKATRQLRKLTDELQDIVMSIRMVPISTTFHKMERIIRDICKKVEKEATLVIRGETTEVDKNVIDSLGDPLMHIVRNAMDHGIELPSERIAAGKDPVGTVILEAKNMGSDVMITISDDGAGLDKDRLVQLGIERGLIQKPAQDVSDQEAYDLIYTAGFSTNDEVTEFSGRGVGMDVAVQNISKVGGKISVSSEKGNGTEVSIRIPLTLAIIDGLQIQVGDAIFVLPILNTRESFKPHQSDDLFTDPDGNEMIMIRGVCYPVVRLNEYFKIPTHTTTTEDGVFIIVEADRNSYCLFVDELIGEQQTVVKPLPNYIARTKGWADSISGCTIMGDGSINLILDINSIQY